MLYSGQNATPLSVATAEQDIHRLRYDGLMHMRHLSLVAAVAAAAVTAASCASDPVARTSAATGPSYVAMGDSAAAAPLVPPQGTPVGCLKSTNNYPSVLARRIGAASFTDVTCSGARTADVVSRAQTTHTGPVPPQLDALRPDTRLVTITIGGNDIELASNAFRCRRTSLAVTPCSADFVIDGVDTVSQAIDTEASAWAALIDAVRAKAPAARVVLVGYGTYVRPAGCFPDEPINPVDAAYFQAKIDELDDRQQRLAADKGVEFFDTRPLSVGHDLCAAPEDRYFEGFAPASPAAPLHPNSMGANAFGTALADYVTAARGG
jgi:lysophospholipase L1-like esterase